jgi:hypothetical protein
MRVLATARDVAVLLILLTTGILGFVDAWESAGYASGSLQGLAVVTQSLYALLGLVSFFVVLLKVRWAVWVLAPWAVAASSTAGLASVVWGGTGLASGLAAAGGAVLFTGLIVWAGSRAVVPPRTGKRNESSS